MTNEEQIKQLREALEELFTSVDDCEDVSAMPDGTEAEGEEHQSFWVAGNVDYRTMRKAAKALGKSFERIYSKPEVVEAEPVEISECQNCGTGWYGHELKPIKDVFERVAPGEPMPSGECPSCGALTQLLVKEAK